MLRATVERSPRLRREAWGFAVGSACFFVGALPPYGTWLNLAGSVAFGASAVGAFVLLETGDLLSEYWANLGTILGAACFFTAALLSRRTIGGAAGEPATGGATD